MKCNQCQMLNINGVPCHETGCPNERKRWDTDNEEWVATSFRCPECGEKYEHEMDAAFCCAPSEDDEIPDEGEEF